ncbi:response regulator [Arthrobacter crystallopoietes]|uniref:Transcriptional regulatory protein n=1 Tax=Crystallibacter crystallopoietes TaxID=37928 RepID=A0A1H1DQD6_9MICC|nr:response regulator [Arthrobacter crystallopoietes]AUI50207.1 two-component system response regulator [Arthrobacter crystallopoietes]SDQ78751.1 two-component system, CitB family, response regulator [Arthrobacter crystallopoietes]
MTNDLQVLIVDDDFHVGRLHASYVEAVPGFAALPPAGTAEQALRVVHAREPDLILLDVYLPDALGLDLLRTLDVDVIMLTAAADAASVRKALRRGALGYLIKPFTADQLTRKLRAYARYRRLLANQSAVDQDTVERALHALHPGEAPGSGRARSATETSVLEALEPGTQKSAADVARQVGISRATAQRYLSALADDGAVEIHLRYGSTGRPEHRYGPVGP